MDGIERLNGYCCKKPSACESEQLESLEMKQRNDPLAGPIEGSCLASTWMASSVERENNLLEIARHGKEANQDTRQRRGTSNPCALT